MTSNFENSRILKPPQDFPAEHHAGHFEHVAQMNMFDDMTTFLRILPKICLVKISAEENPEFSGLEDKNFKVLDPADSASFKNGSSFKLLNIVSQDLQLSDSEDRESEKITSPSSKKTSNKEREDCQEKAKTDEDLDNEDSVQWAKARKRVEEFLDFPALISAMQFRDNTESSKSSQTSPTSNNQQVTLKKAADLIPNTRHNAVFLRDNPKAAQVILKSPYYNGEHLKRDQPVLKLAEKPNTKHGARNRC